MGDVVKKSNNPWKGLQSYQENDVIYGRDDEIKALYTRIVYNTQTVVYGKSGIGKSSIINAGIIPRAKYDGMLPVSIRLAHTTKKEQTATAPYVGQIFQRIKEEVEKNGGELEEVVKHTVDHKETLWEMLHRYRIWEGKEEHRKRIIPLLLLDQFEEIFTLEINSKRVDEFFSELADLLNEIRPTYLTQAETEEINNSQLSQEKSELPKSRNVFSKIANRKRKDSSEYLERSEFHLVITLREDFLSYLERYTAYIPVMKQNRFPLLPLNEEQAAKIITEPVRNLIQPEVAEIIIQRVTGRNDFKLDGIPEIEVDAALLSLYMEQLYERKDKDDQEITSELVVQSDDIIKKFYEESIAGIAAETIEYLEDELITNANRRNNVARIDLLSGGVSEEDLDKLIEKKVLRQFSYGGDLRIEFIHDILCPIVNDRIEHRERVKRDREEQKKREEEEARRKEEEAEEEARREKERQIQEEKLRKAEEEKQILLRKQQLQEEENRLLQRKQEEELARAEKEKQLQEEQLKRAEEDRKLLLKKQILQEEENRLMQRQKEEENAKLREEAIRIRKRNRRRLYAICSFLILLVMGFTSYWFWYEKEYKASYASFTTIDGWPIGIGKELNDYDKRQLPVYYQLVRKGYTSQNTRVNILNSYKEIACNIFNESPLVGLYETEGEDKKASGFAMLQRQTAYWIYTPDNDGNILRKTAYAPDGKELYAVQYFRSSAFTGSNDAQDSQKKQLWANYVDKDGKSLRIRDNGADRVRIMNDSTGYVIGHQFYSETGTPQPNDVGAYGYRYKLGNDGRCIKKIPVDAFGDLSNDKVIFYGNFDEFGRWTEIKGGKAIYSRDWVVFSMTNRTDSLRFGDKGELSYRSESHNDGHRRVFKYEKGQVVSTRLYRPTNNGIVLAYSRIVLPKREQNVIETQVFWADSTKKYRIKRETFKKSQTIVAYYKGNSPSSIDEPLSVITKEGQYHKIVTDTTRENGFLKVTTNYLNEMGVPSSLCKFNRDISYYNKNFEMIKHYVYKDENLLYAYLNEYEDGQIIAQSVLGVDGRPLRYAGHDIDKLCYFKMKLIYNFSNTLVAIKGINEFNEESLITFSDNEYSIDVLPSHIINAKA